MMNKIKNIINKIFQNKVLIITGILAGVIGIAIFITGESPDATYTRPRYETTPYEERIQEEHERKAVPIVVDVMQVSPKDGAKVDMHFRMRLPILYTLTEPVVARTAKVEIEPRVPVTIRRHRVNKHILTVYPNEDWKSDVEYKVTLKKGLKSERGNFLTDDYTHTFTLHLLEELPPNYLADPHP